MAVGRSVGASRPKGDDEPLPRSDESVCWRSARLLGGAWAEVRFDGCAVMVLGPAKAMVCLPLDYSGTVPPGLKFLLAAIRLSVCCSCRFHASSARTESSSHKIRYRSVI